MNFENFLESTSQKLVICDVQPAYKKAIWFDMKEFCQFAMTYPEVVVLFNGPEFGFESSGQIANWYKSFGIPAQTLRSWRWHEKNYAWFRGLMDSRGCPMREEIVKIIRFMIRSGKNDSRELTKEDYKKIKTDRSVQKILSIESIHIPDLGRKIRGLNGSDICGGGLNECLEEVMLLADATNTRLNKIDEFIY